MLPFGRNVATLLNVLVSVCVLRSRCGTLRNLGSSLSIFLIFSAPALDFLDCLTACSVLASVAEFCLPVWFCL